MYTGGNLILRIVRSEKMKKSILFLVCALLGTGSAFATAASSITDVNAQSVSSGNFAQVDVDQAQVYD
mgnify:CR=1 FL=1